VLFDIIINFFCRARRLCLMRLCGVFKLRTYASFCPFLSSLQKVSRIIPKRQFRVLFCNPKYQNKYQRENLVVFINPSQLFVLWKKSVTTSFRDIARAIFVLQKPFKSTLLHSDRRINMLRHASVTTTRRRSFDAVVNAARAVRLE
jgi:hypothetical protein